MVENEYIFIINTLRNSGYNRVPGSFRLWTKEDTSEVFDSWKEAYLNYLGVDSYDEKDKEI